MARGSGPALSSLAALLLLHEAPSLQGLGGLALVVGGIVLVAAGAPRKASAASPAPVGTGVRWGLATGALIAGYTAVDAWGVKVLAIAPVLLDWFGNLAQVGMIAPWVVRDRHWRRAMRGHWRLAAAVGALSPLSYILVLGAYAPERR